MATRTIVAAGDFRIDKKKRGESLVACLGSCVGVAIVDVTAGIGGLLHVLLADDSGAGAAFGERVCARTALPEFIRGLVAAGATPATMTATVAGGGLVGEVSAIDLDLDIGGRTADAANQLLGAAGIGVAASETGGHETRTLVLDLDTLAARIEAVLGESAEGIAWPPPLTPQDVAGAVARLRPVPQAALKIMRMLRGDEYGLQQIAREVGRDQVLTARVLQACNAAHRGGRGEIRSIDQALFLLGGRLVGALILSSAMASFFGGPSRGYSLTRGGLYRHAMSAAIIAEQLAAASGRVPRDVAYTAGLLHDVGKVLLDQYVATARPLFYRDVMESDTALRDVERSVLGLTHDEAGARLAELWSLPDDLKDAIAHHSDPTEATDDRTLTSLVYVADLLALRFDAGHDLDRLSARHLPDALAHLGLPASSLPGLLAGIDWRALVTSGYL